MSVFISSGDLKFLGIASPMVKIKGQDRLNGAVPILAAPSMQACAI